MPVLTIGFLLVLFFGFILNVFVTGGLFSMLDSKNETKNLSRFFAGAAENFWSFMVIILMTISMVIVSAGLVGGIPMLIVSGSESGTPAPGAIGKTIKIAFIILAIVLPVFLLVADYARAWQVNHSEKKPFRAIGFGFSKTFSTFFISYPMMLILVAVQTGVGAYAASNLLGAKPDTGGKVFIFLLLSQVLFIVKILMRAWRYGSVASAMEDVKVVYQDQSVQAAEPLPGQA
ncbi:MAG: hypothetical protein HZB98_12885 [Bacteroidia bacterium]|nr:hypothetical protein [Bacteroidia bacterium]